MEPSVSDLKQLRESELAAIDQVLASAKAEGRDQDSLSEAELARIEQHTAKSNEYGRQIAASENRQRVLQEAANARAQATVAAEKQAKPGRPVVEVVGDARERDPKRGFASAADFFTSVKNAAVHAGYGIDQRLFLGAVSGLSTKVGPEGGFAVPPEFSTAIWDAANISELENIFASTDQIPVSGKELTLNANAETSRANGSRYGGIRHYWLDEGGTLTASKPKLRQISLRPHKLAVLAYMTSELLEQGPAMQTYLERAAGSEIRFGINDAIVNGNGTGKPLGVLGSNCLVSVSGETGQTSATPLMAINIDKMWARCHANARSGAVWYINQELEPYLQSIGREVGTSGIPAYMPPGGLSAAPYGTLKGRPVVVSEFCAGAATVGDIILGNFGWYATGVRGGLRAESSMHVQFLTDEMTFRFIFYVDGQPYMDSPITPYKATGTHTLSPFVALATRS